MTERPELKRYDRLGIGLRVESRPDEATLEPPSRTLIYRLRPSRPGQAVLPPVAVAAFDPAVGRYITHVTAGVPIRVLEVPAFDPATLADGELVGGAGGSSGQVGLSPVWVGASALLVGAAGALAWVRRHGRRGRPQGPAAARRFAIRLGRDLAFHRSLAARTRASDRGAVPSAATGDRSHTVLELALQITAGLVRYLELGLGRPPGALTPDEANQGVALCTGSDALGAQAGRLATRCDLMLYREGPPRPEMDLDRLREDARGLFSALGRVKTSGRRIPGGTGAGPHAQGTPHRPGSQPFGQPIPGLGRGPVP
jgi:hypothetical protein